MPMIDVHLETPRKWEHEDSLYYGMQS